MRDTSNPSFAKQIFNLSCSQREDGERGTGNTDSNSFERLSEGISRIEKSGAADEGKEKQFYHGTDFYTAQMLCVKGRHEEKSKI